MPEAEAGAAKGWGGFRRRSGGQQWAGTVQKAVQIYNIVASVWLETKELFEDDDGDDDGDDDNGCSVLCVFRASSN